MVQSFTPIPRPSEQTQENIDSQNRGYPVNPPSGEPISYPALNDVNQIQRNGVINTWLNDTKQTLTDDIGRVVNGYFGMTGIFASHQTFNICYQKSGASYSVEGEETSRVYPFILRVPAKTMWHQSTTYALDTPHTEYILVSWQEENKRTEIYQVGEWGDEHAYVNQRHSFWVTELLPDETETLPIRVQLDLEGATEERVITELRSVVDVIREHCGDASRMVYIDDLRRYTSGHENNIWYNYIHDATFTNAQSDEYFTLFYENMFHCDFPVWDIQTPDLAHFIEQYLNEGKREGEYDWGGDVYVPPFDTFVDDTSTIWNAQVQNTDAGETRLTLSWGCKGLGAMPKWARRKWKVQLTLIGVSTLGATVINPHPKMKEWLMEIDTLDYLKRTTNIDLTGIVSDAYDDGAFNDVTLPPYGNRLTQLRNYVYRIAFRIFSDDQLSDLGWVDMKVGDGWDYGFWTNPRTDDSVINIDYYDGTIDDPDIPDDDSDDDEDTPDDGYRDPDIPDDDDIPDGDPVNVGGLFGTTYKMTQAELLAVSSYFWNDGADGFIEKYINSVNDPIACIVSCGYMPVDASGTAGANVYVGNVQMTGCTGTPIHTTTIRNVIGSYKIPETFKSFLDYQPFTNISIWLPYIGLKTLPANEFVGKTIKVAYCFDLITGSCKAQIYADNKFKVSYDGLCMVTIPLTATNNSDRLMAQAQAGIGIGTSMFTGDYLGALDKAIDTAMIKHTTETNGSVSGALGSCDTKAVFLKFDVPMVQYPNTYNHNVGRPCDLSCTLSQLNGYTVCAEGVDVSGIPCTRQEREQIKSYLTTGVIL